MGYVKDNQYVTDDGDAFILKETESHGKPFVKLYIPMNTVSWFTEKELIEFGDFLKKYVNEKQKQKGK